MGTKKPENFNKLADNKIFGSLISLGIPYT